MARHISNTQKPSVHCELSSRLRDDAFSAWMIVPSLLFSQFETHADNEIAAEYACHIARHSEISQNPNNR